jgi:hypothetical protein
MSQKEVAVRLSALIRSRHRDIRDALSKILECANDASKTVAGNLLLFFSLCARSA